MPTLSTLRKASTWIALGLLGAVAFGTISEWFIHVAEDKGWYRDAGKNWDRIMTILVSFLTAPFMSYLTLGFLSFAAGMWTDYILYRRERAPIEAAMNKAAIDRQKLARDAMKFGKAICTLAADGNAKLRVAWETDAMRMANGSGISRESSVREEQIVIEKYAQDFHGEVWRIIDAASRILNMDANSVWRISHGINGMHDLHSIGRFLISISNELRFPGNPVLPDTRMLEEEKRADEQNASLQLQSETR